MSNRTKINVSNLSVFYERQKVINNINVCINDRSVTTFIGPSGCGKTTFLRCLNRMNDLFPSFSFQGKIFLDSLDIYDKNVTLEHLRSRVGMVFQKPVPFVMSIYDNIAYGPRIHKLVSSKSHLDDIVEKSLRQAFLWKDVSSRLHKSALSLSGGQQQRLCIARAIAVEPDVILMDEPTSSLDPISTSKIEELLDHLKKKYCIVMITHSMNQAARVSDMVGFIYESNMVEFGPCQDMFTNPTHKLTQDYITGCY